MESLQAKQNKKHEELGNSSNFINRMVVCERRDSIDDYKVWKMEIYIGKDTFRYNDHYSSYQLWIPE